MSGREHDETPDLRSDPDIPGGIRYDPDLAVHEPAEVPAEPTPPSRRRSPLFLFPAGLLLLAAVVYVLFGLLAGEGKTPSDYLDAIRLRRADAWEPAFQLSRLLVDAPIARRDPRFIPDLIVLFRTSRGEDPRLRRYLALSLGETRDARGVDPLLEALDDADPQTVIYAVWGLGTIGEPRAAGRLLPLLEHEDPGLRKIAAYALGALDAPAAVQPLRALLHDPVEDVAWNAALSLARRGDRAAVPLLVRMLDRSYLESVRPLDDGGRPIIPGEDQEVEVITGALRSLTGLRDTDHLEAIRALRDHDPSLKVRQAAFEALAKLQPAPPPS